MLHGGFRIDDHLPTTMLVDLFCDTTQPAEKRWAACLALGTKPEEAAFDVLREALRDPDWQIRRLALEAIKRHARAREAAPEIVQQLFDVDDLVRQMACKICGELGLQSAHAGVLQLLEVENPDVRDVALCTLLTLWQDGDFERVYRCYREDPQRAVRIAAAKVLRRKANFATWRRLFIVWSVDREVRHRLWACELAARFGGQAAKWMIEPLARDRNRNVREAAVTALAGLGS